MHDETVRFVNTGDDTTDADERLSALLDTSGKAQRRAGKKCTSDLDWLLTPSNAELKYGLLEVVISSLVPEMTV